jgi:hypothetical protein
VIRSRRCDRNDERCRERVSGYRRSDRANNAVKTITDVRNLLEPPNEPQRRFLLPAPSYFLFSHFDVFIPTCELLYNASGVPAFRL